MRIRVWSPVQVVPDVTGTKQHTEQMFVVDTYSKHRIFRATKRNIKHEGASKGPCTYKSRWACDIAGHSWARMGRESPDGQEAWKVTAAAAGGFQGRVADREWEKTGAKILRKVRVAIGVVTVLMRKNKWLKISFEMFEKHKVQLVTKSMSHCQQP